MCLNAQLAFAGGSKTVNAGDTVSIAWSNSNAACTRSVSPYPGSPANEQWSGTVSPNTNGTTVVGPLYIPGIYNYICDDGNVADNVTITVNLTPSVSSIRYIGSGKTPTVTWSATTPTLSTSTGASSCEVGRTVYYDNADAWNGGNTITFSVVGSGNALPVQETFTSTAPTTIAHVYYRVRCWGNAYGQNTDWVYAPAETTVGDARVWFTP